MLGALLQQRRRRKLVKHLLREARHARHMREDVASPEDLRHLDRARDALLQARRQKAAAATIDRLAEALAEAIPRLYPARRHLRLRENVEVIVVAVAVAMAFRTYFVQPFKIPTGSMQPTLFGITVEARAPRTLLDRPPLNLVQWLLSGQRYRNVRARISGPVSEHYEVHQDRSLVIFISGVPHTLHADMRITIQPGDYVRRGELLASGSRTLGDHILVDKVRYNFRRPRRGDVFVFDTRSIEHPRIEQDTFYIKRLVGLPGERVGIRPPHLIVNGEPVMHPYAFRRQVESPGYEGYVFPGNDPSVPVKMTPTAQPLNLGDDEYLAFGDNTTSSLDSRYFGAIRQEDIVGPAFMVYWPLSRRWGPIR